MIAEVGGIIIHHGHERELAADLAAGGTECGSHAVVARIESSSLALGTIPLDTNSARLGYVDAPWLKWVLAFKELNS